jgi:hypothetical protein
MPRLLFLLILLLSSWAQAAEPIRLYTVAIAWQGGPTLTQQVSPVDRFTFAGPLRMKHLKAELELRITEELAWNIRTQVKSIVAKLAEFEANTFDPLQDAEMTTAINDLESFGAVINYRAPTLTLDFPVKIGKLAPIVRVTVERLPDAIHAAD